MGLALLAPSVVSEICARLFLNGHSNPAVQILTSLALTSVPPPPLTYLVHGWLAGPHAVYVKPRRVPAPHFPSHAAAVTAVGQQHPPWGSASLSLPRRLSVSYKYMSSCLKTHSREPEQMRVILKKSPQPKSWELCFIWWEFLGLQAWETESQVILRALLQGGEQMSQGEQGV